MPSPSNQTLCFVSAQKWDAKLSADDSMVAFDIMEQLGFRKRSEFIRHALTNPILIAQENAFLAMLKAADDLEILRAQVVETGLDPKTARKLEAELRQIARLLQEAVQPCPDHI